MYTVVPRKQQPKRFLFSKVAEGLAEEQRVGSCVLKGEHIVVARVGVAVLRPKRSATEVGAEREHYWRTLHHRLVEVCWREAALLFIGSCHHYAVKLQVAHCLRALRLAEQAAQQRVAYRSIGVLAYAATCVDCLHISVVIVVPKLTAYILRQLLSQKTKLRIFSVLRTTYAKFFAYIVIP